MSTKKKPLKRQIRIIKNNLAKIQSDYEIIDRHLNTIIRDHELMLEGWKIYFIVDFYDIWEFGFPWGKDYLMEDIKVDDRINGKFQSILARIFLFYGMQFVDKPILLPIYSQELQDRLEFIEYEIIEKKEKIIEGLMENKFQNLLDSKEINFIKSIDQWYKKNKNKPLPKEMRNKVLNIIKLKFSELFSIITIYPDGISLMYQLFKDKRVDKHSKVWAKYPDLAEKTYSKDLDWLIVFNHFHPDRKLPNIRDSVAVQQIFDANKIEAHKRLYFLVSGSEKMGKAFSTPHEANEEINMKYKRIYRRPPDRYFEHKKLKGERICPYRDIELLQTYIIFKTYSRQETMKSMRDFRENNLNRYYELKSSISKLAPSCEMLKECKDCDKDFREKCNKALSDSKMLVKKHKEVKELLRARGREGYLRPYKNIFKDYSKRQQERERSMIKLLLNFLTSKDKEVQTELINLIEKTEDIVQKTLMGILVDTEYMVNSFGNKLRKISSRPFRYKFKDQEILKSIEIILNDRSPKKYVEKNIHKIIKKLETEEGGDIDSDLLKCLFLFSHDAFNRSWGLIKKIEQKNYYDDLTEFQLLKIQIFYQKIASKHYYRKLDREIENIKTIFNNNSSDVRFYIFYGAALYYLFGYTNNVEYLDESIEISKKGLSLKKYTSPTLKIALLNNLIYASLTEDKNTTKKIKVINNYANEMLETAEKNKIRLRPSQYHTLSQFYFIYSKFLYNKASVAWKDKLRKAKKMSMKAQQGFEDKVFPSSIRIMKKDYGNIKKFEEEIRERERYKYEY